VSGGYGGGVFRTKFPFFCSKKVQLPVSVTSSSLKKDKSQFFERFAKQFTTTWCYHPKRETK
jgi:hypothetical protein